MVAVCGQYVYVLTSNFTPTVVGQLNSNSGQVGITDNGLNVYIVDGTNRYTWRISNPSSAQFLGSISGTTLTVSLMQSGTITVGQQLFGLNLGNKVWSKNIPIIKPNIPKTIKIIIIVNNFIKLNFKFI